MKEIILGKWTQSKSQGGKHGVGVETFFGDGTKTSEVTLFDANQEAKVISAKSVWHLNKNVLTEEVVSIDKAFSKKFGIKPGLKLRSYIVELSPGRLELKPLGRKADNTVYVRG